MARGHGRDRVLVSGGRRPAARSTRCGPTAGERGTSPRSSPSTDGRGGAPEVGPDVAAVDRAAPERLRRSSSRSRELFGAAHDGGARAIQVFDPLSLGVLAPPGELGADIAVAEGQCLGNHLNYGGPYLGLIAARLDDVRRMPGPDRAARRVDVDGTTGYVLTLQAREQHIRREKANSNICTNQTLMAIAATIYLAWLGPGRARGARPAVRVEGRIRGRAARALSTASSCCTPTRRSSRSSPCDCRARRPTVRDALDRRGIPGRRRRCRRGRPRARWSRSPSGGPATRSTGSPRRFAEVLA